MYGFTIEQIQHDVKPPRPYKAGRVCRKCRRALSKYNPGPFCYSCDEEMIERDNALCSYLMEIMGQLIPPGAEPGVIETYVLKHWPSVRHFCAEAGWSDEVWRRFIGNDYKRTSKRRKVDQINGMILDKLEGQ